MWLLRGVVRIEKTSLEVRRMGEVGWIRSRAECWLEEG